MEKSIFVQMMLSLAIDLLHDESENKPAKKIHTYRYMVKSNS